MVISGKIRLCYIITAAFVLYTNYYFDDFMILSSDFSSFLPSVNLITISNEIVTPIAMSHFEDFIDQSLVRASDAVVRRQAVRAYGWEI